VSAAAGGLCRVAGLAFALLAAAVQAGESPWETITPGGATGCSDGSPYAFHVRHADPQRVLLFFNGGGACWNTATCDPTGKPTYRVTAGAGSGNDPREYDGAFALDNPENPLRGWSQVFVSYCTGDVHLGRRDAQYAREDGSRFTVAHRGRDNSDAVLDYVFARFPDPQQVLVAGGSAGALASPVYAAVVAAQYPRAQVLHLAGGGAGYRLPPPQQLWSQWGVIPALPPPLDAADATPETLYITDLYRLAARATPGIRFHTYDNAFDAVQEQFMALLGSPGELLPGLDDNLRELRADLPQLRSYVAPGDFHTLLRYRELYTRDSDGVRAVDWVSALVNGEAVNNVHCGEGACRDASP
jgi:hypothetical protein